MKIVHSKLISYMCVCMLGMQFVGVASKGKTRSHQRVLGFRSSCRMTVEILYIVVQVVYEIYMCYTDGDPFFGPVPLSRDISYDGRQVLTPAFCSAAPGKHFGPTTWTGEMFVLLRTLRSMDNVNERGQVDAS